MARGTVSIPAIRAVFFDAVGTIMHPAEPVAATYRRMATAHGLDLPEVVIRSRIIDAFTRQEELDRQAGWRTDERREVERWRAIVTETLREADDREACFRDLWAHYSHAAAWRVDPDLRKVVEKAPDGIVLGIASNFDGRLTGIVGQMAELERLRPSVVVSSIIGWRKPAKEFFDEVVKIAGRDPAEILFVGDDYRNDYLGASEAGMRTALIDATGRFDADHRIASLGELQTLLNSFHFVVSRTHPHPG